MWRLGFGDLGEEAEARGDSQATNLHLFEFFLLHFMNSVLIMFIIVAFKMLG